MTQKPTNNDNKATYQLAWRAGSEMIAGILVGLFFGYLIDRFFYTKPWGMIGMIILGALAGMRNIFRVVDQDRKAVDSNHSD